MPIILELEIIYEEATQLPHRLEPVANLPDLSGSYDTKLGPIEMRLGEVNPTTNLKEVRLVGPLNSGWRNRSSSLQEVVRHLKPGKTRGRPLRYYDIEGQKPAEILVLTWKEVLTNEDRNQYLEMLLTGHSRPQSYLEYLVYLGIAGR